MWLRHAPAPLLWIHPVAKNRVLMPDGDSNAIFYSSGIFIVGTCPPMKMVGKFTLSTNKGSAPLAECRTFLFLDPLVALDGQFGADGLQHLHQHDQQRRGHKFQHHVEAVVAVVDGHLA